MALSHSMHQGWTPGDVQRDNQTACGLRNFQPLEIYAVGANLSEIVLRLLYKPAFRTATKDLR